VHRVPPEEHLFPSIGAFAGHALPFAPPREASVLVEASGSLAPELSLPPADWPELPLPPRSEPAFPERPPVPKSPPAPPGVTSFVRRLPPAPCEPPVPEYAALPAEEDEPVDVPDAFPAPPEELGVPPPPDPATLPVSPKPGGRSALEAQAEPARQKAVPSAGPSPEVFLGITGSNQMCAAACSPSSVARPFGGPIASHLLLSARGRAALSMKGHGR